MPKSKIFNGGKAMCPAGEMASNSRQESHDLTERLRTFMQAHDLNLEELAALLHTQPQTLAHWFGGGMAPPACLLALMILIDTLPQARNRLRAPSIAAARSGSFDHAGRIRPGERNGGEASRNARAA
jgi:transcriptional regulator with XRE-family HTH domain